MKKIIQIGNKIKVDVSNVEMQFVKFYGDNNGLTYIVMNREDLALAMILQTALELKGNNISFDGDYLFIDTSDYTITFDLKTKCFERTDQMYAILDETN